MRLQCCLHGLNNFPDGKTVNTSSYTIFLGASIALILAPGPSQALVISKSLADGWRAGVLTAIGLNIGTLFHAAAAAVGLSAIVATSATVFAIVKYVGGAYLIYLGIQSFRARNASGQPAMGTGENESTVSVFGKALAVGILNPKVAIFFLALLPQFVDVNNGNVFVQFMVLGATIAVLDVIYESILIACFIRMSRTVRNSSRLHAWRNRMAGGVMVLLGVRLALQEQGT